jgi:hypothetical protein
MKNFLKKIAAVTGLFLVAALCASVINHFLLKAAANQYRAELKARGEPMTLAEVIPPPVPAEKNSAGIFLEAAALISTNQTILSINPPMTMHGIAPGKALVAWQLAEVRSEFGTNSWKEIESALAEDDAAIALLLKITNGATMDFDLKYQERFEMLLHHLSKEKKAALTLAYAAMLDLHDGKADLAAEKLRVIFALADATRDERTAISQLVRIAVAQIGFNAVWEWMQSTNLNDAQLAAMQTNCSRLEFLTAMKKVLPVEREGCMATTDKWRRAHAEMRRYFEVKQKVTAWMDNADQVETSGVGFEVKVFLWRYWWSYSDEVRYLRGMEVLTGTLRQVETNGAFQTALSAQSAALDKMGFSKMKSSLDTLFSTQTDFHSILSESVVTLAGLAHKIMRVETARQMTTTAIALKRFELEHGSYPTNLDLLVPKFISALPRDPVDGQPLRYRLLPDGAFRLYSVGENGADDGGNPALEKNVESENLYWLNPHALDWVWPQPATADEVQAYFSAQAKKSK